MPQQILPENVTVFLINLFFNFTIQSISYILGIYALIGRKIERKKYLLGTAAVLIIGIVIRLLPIQRGVHTLLMLAMITLVTSFFFQFPVYTAVKASLASMITLLIIEGLSLITYKFTLSPEVYDSIIEGNSLPNAISGIPANILFFVVMFIIYINTSKSGRSLVGDAGENPEKPTVDEHTDKTDNRR